MPPRKTLYDILQIAPNASQEVVKAAYDKVVQLIEQERTSFSSDDTENRLKAAKEAFRVLGDPQARSLYDQRLAPKDDEPDAAPVEPPSKTNRWIAIALLTLAGLGYYNIHLSNQRAAVAAEAARAQAEAEKERLAAEQERLRLERTEKVTNFVQTKLQEQDEARRSYEMERIQREIKADENAAARQAAQQKLLEEQAAETRVRREQYEAQARAARERAAIQGIQKGRDARLNY